MIPKPHSCSTMFSVHITIIIMSCNSHSHIYEHSTRMGGELSTGYRWYDKRKCSLIEWVQKIRDLRYFKMHSSRRKGLIGTREVRRCIGNLYCSYDDCLFKLSTGGKRNTSNLQNMDEHKTFFICGHVANREWCGV